jgi:hypothetical protein
VSGSASAPSPGAQSSAADSQNDPGAPVPDTGVGTLPAPAGVAGAPPAGVAGTPTGPAGVGQATGQAPVGEPAAESCPLCGAPLDPDQDWCLRCGAAARTRLATSPVWRAPIVALAVVAVLALGVLAAALVKIAGKSGSTTTTITRSVPFAATPTPTATTNAPTSTQVAPGTRISTTGSGGVAPSSTTPGAGAKPSTPPGATGFSFRGLTTGHPSTPTTPTTPHTTSVPKTSTPTTGSANGEVAQRLRELLNRVRKTYGK